MISQENKTRVVSWGPDPHSLRWLGAILILGISLIPPFNLIHQIGKIAGTNPSNDASQYLFILDQALSGNYNWMNFFRDTSVGLSDGHSSAIPIFLQVLLARLGLWSIPVIIWTGIFLTLSRVFLLFFLLTVGWKNFSRWLFLPLLLFLTFSISQISTFGYELTTLQYGFLQLGLALGMLGVFHAKAMVPKCFLVGYGGILACYSYGAGPLLWPLFAAAAWLTGERRGIFYLFLGLSALIGILPYFNVLHLQNGARDFPISLGWNPQLIFSGLGLPFAQGFSLSQANFRGIIGILFFALLVIYLAIYRDIRLWKRSLPGFFLATFALLFALQVSIFRDNLAHWYTTNFMLFWIGLAGIAVSLIFIQGASVKSRFGTIFGRIWGVAFIITLGFFFFSSNRTYLDKAELFKTRAPGSEACLRAYPNIPPECESLLFVDEPGRPERMNRIAGFLKKHQLSIFSDRQELTLQGDMKIPNKVSTLTIPEVPAVQWVSLQNEIPPPWEDFRRLALYLHAPNQVIWTVTLPRKLRNAELFSAVALNPNRPREELSDGVVFEIQIEDRFGKISTYFSRKMESSSGEWFPVSISLNKFSGQTIKIHFITRARDNFIHDWGLFNYPRIKVNKV